MDKEILIQNLEMEDLIIYPDLEDIADISGLPFVQELLRKHSGARFYVPDIRNMKSVLERFIKENKEQYNEYQIARMIGCRVEVVRSILYKRR